MCWDFKCTGVASASRRFSSLRLFTELSGSRTWQRPVEISRLLGRSGYFIYKTTGKGIIKISVDNTYLPEPLKSFLLGKSTLSWSSENHLYMLACGSIYCSSYRTSLAIEMRRFCQSVKDHNLWRCEGFRHRCPRVNEFDLSKMASFNCLNCWTFTIQNPYFATTELNCRPNDTCRIWGLWSVLLTHYTNKIYPEAWFPAAPAGGPGRCCVDTQVSICCGYPPLVPLIHLPATFCHLSLKKSRCKRHQRQIVRNCSTKLQCTSAVAR